MNEWNGRKSSFPVPLNGLRAFEAAARHMSIKNAARELNLTPSAISHRLRVLESVLGHKLMQRVGANLELTDFGKSLAPPLSVAFAQILNAVEDVMRDQSTPQNHPEHSSTDGTEHA